MFSRNGGISLKRFGLSALLVPALLLSISTTTLAASNQSAPQLPDPGSAISSDDAANLAIWFMANHAKNTPDSTWKNGTKIYKITPMVDGDGNTTAYAIEFVNGMAPAGYVVISASDDEGLIKEYAYEGWPEFRDINGTDFDDVLYVGPLDYAVSKSGKTYGMGKAEIAAVHSKAHFKKAPEYRKLNKEYLDKVRGPLKLDLSNWVLGYKGTDTGASGYGGITDPTSYVNDKYGTGWTLSASKFLPVIGNLTSSWPDNNNCSIVALTSIFQYWRNQQGKTNIPYDVNQIYATVKDNATKEGYTPDGGTPYYAIDNIAVDSWKSFNYSSGSATSVYVWTYSTFTGEVDANRPAVMNLSSGFYPNHSVTLMGYETFTKSWNTDKGFLAVKDGWVSYTRFIDFAELVNSGTFASLTKVTP